MPLAPVPAMTPVVTAPWLSRPRLPFEPAEDQRDRPGNDHVDQRRVDVIEFGLGLNSIGCNTP